MPAPVQAIAIYVAEAGGYVAAAYSVFVALLLIYVVIMASRLVRIQRTLSEIDAKRDESR